ncbi:MAG: hypothetical protein WCK00_09700 [Deltaproteobacteria bacterium]
MQTSFVPDKYFVVTLRIIPSLDLVREARVQRGGAKPLIRLIPSKIISRASLSNDLPGSLAELGEAVLPGIGQRTVVAEAALEGKTVAEYSSVCPARTEFQRLARGVAKLLTGRIK